jgi:hypothetical protein
MSTILDALRKVERERDPSQDRVLERPTVVAESGRRLPMWVMAMGAIVGFGIGGVLSWRQVEEPTTEVAAFPAVPPPPAIAVPRPPVPGAAAPLPAAPARVETETQVVDGPPPPATAPESVAVAAPPATAPSAIENPKAAADRILAAIQKEDTVLEPSPFSVPREEPPAPAPAAAPAARPVRPPPAAQTEPDQVAAVQPAVPPVPEALEALREVEPEPEAEPEATPDALVDTGRSPPGAPKVALSFLQWSADPAKRFAFISVDGGATQRVREGEVTSGLTVAAITPTGIQFKREGTTFVIRPRH